MCVCKTAIRRRKQLSKSRPPKGGKKRGPTPLVASKGKKK